MIDADLRKSEAEKLGLEYLGTIDVKFENETLHDNIYSTKGWQYKKIGNSTLGNKKYNEILKNSELLEDLSKCARNDSDPRYYIKKIFKIDDKKIVKITNSPSRSGKSTTWYFFYITKI